MPFNGRPRRKTRCTSAVRLGRGHLHRNAAGHDRPSRDGRTKHVSWRLIASPTPELLRTMLDHLICDCDGVLVDSEVIADRVLLDTLSATFPHIDFA